MAVNLATKYEKQLATAMTLESVIAGRTNTEYEFTGVKSINILTPVTQALNDYTRTGANRYGTPTELQDTKQELTLTKDKSFSITVDKGNNSDQQFIKKAGKVVKAQVGEQCTPFWDKNALAVWATTTNKKIVATPDKDSALDMFIDARKHLIDNNFQVNINDCTAYVSSTVYALLLKNPLFMGVETLAKEMLTKGTVGQSMNFLIKEVPAGYLPVGCHAIFTHKKAVLAVDKLNELKIHDNPPGINGALIEGRQYGDAFVLDVFKNGVYKSTAS
ncbi:MAG: hypothetical protein GX666_08285 [Tissierellia bacterium]|nr:hypothetical protein [Tissierellia bacterium]